MMQRYIAFLRAINVGGHNVKMEHLRQMFATLGFSNVETFIASGNVIFETPDGDAAGLEALIESNLRENLGYDVATLIRTPAELAAIANYQPFPPEELEAEGNYLYVDFLKSAPNHAVQSKVAALQTPADEFHLHNRELYWLCRKKISESQISGALLEKTVGMPATMRNVTTVKKLAAKYPAD